MSSLRNRLSVSQLTFLAVALYLQFCSLGSGAEFTKLPTEFDARAMALAEDLKTLVIAHESANKLSVWDVATNKQRKLVDCPAPRSILWRGTKVYVANYGKGTISVFDTERDWRLSDQVQAASPNVFHLAAPQSKYFDGKLVASTEQGWFWIDAKKDENKHYDIGSSRECATVDFAGKYLMTPSGRVYPFLPQYGRNSMRSAFASQSSFPDSSWLEQVREGTHWFGDRVVARGMPPKFVKQVRQPFLVPDRSRKVYYEFSSSQSVSCFGLDSEQTLIAKRPIVYPDKSPAFGTADRGPQRFDKLPHLALTTENDLTFYVLDVSLGSIFTCKMKPFDVGAEALANAKEGSQRREFPKFVAVGKTVTFQLPDVEDGFRASGLPHGMAVSESGELTWTPTDQYLGMRRISISGRVGNRSRNYRFQTTVVKEIPEGAKPGYGIFTELQTVEPITGMAITDDRQHLLLAHQAANKVSVWDVRAQEVVALFETPSPIFIIARGDRAYVAGQNQETVRVFSRADGWKLADLIPAPHGIFYMSAPQGRFFTGKILVTTMASPNSTRGTSAWLIDEKTKKTSNLRRDKAIVTSSYNGKYYLTQGFIGNTSSIRSYAAYPFPESGEASNVILGQHRAMEFLKQAHPGDVWHSTTKVYKGVPPSSSHMTRQMNAQIPDSERCVVYRLSDNAITCIALDDTGTVIGTQTALLSAGEPGSYSRVRSNDAPRLYTTAAKYHGNIAVTLNDKTHFFLFSEANRAVMYTAIDAFDVKPAVNAAAEIACGRNTFPAAVPIGKELRFSLLGIPTNGKFELKGGPTEVTISDEGLLSWSPTSKDLGRKQIQIQATLDNNTALIKLRTRVVMPEDLDRTLANPTNLENAGQFRLGLGVRQMRFSRDGKTVLVLDGQSLIELSSDGMDLVFGGKIVAPNSSSTRTYSYKVVDRRGDYYVALWERGIDILDGKTLNRMRSVSLPFKSMKALALHPSKPLCYVSLLDNGRDGDLLRQYPVVEVDEVKGTVRSLGRVFGMGVSVDPRGRYLYTAFDDRLAQSQTRREVVPGQNLDPRLLCYSLNDGGAQIKHLRANNRVGTGFLRLVAAPDGQNLAYVCRDNLQGGRGSRAYSFATDASGDPTFLETGNAVLDITYHPILPIVAVAAVSKIHFFDRVTGKPIEDMIQLPKDLDFTYLKHCIFTPDGTRILLPGSRHGTAIRTLRSVELNLSPDQLAVVASGFVPPPIEQLKLPVDQAIAKRYSPDKIQAFARTTGREATDQETPGQETTPRQIARRFGSTVVAVQGDSTAATGCIVGQEGYVLTSASVLPPIGVPEIYYRYTEGNVTKTAKANGKLVREDHDRNLALLKFETPTPLKTVQFAAAKRIAIAEDVTVLFSPDAQPTELSPSVLKGIIKTASRDFGGKKFVETSIKTDEAMHGAPIFSSNGQVIGIVADAQTPNSTAARETGFGVPISSIVEFLDPAGKASVAMEKTVANVMRTWVDVTGKFRVKAQFVRVDGNTVHLKRDSGTVIKVPLSRLSQNDQQFIRTLSSQ